MALDKELLDILACPQCNGSLHLSEKEDGVICDACRLIYPVREEIPVMLIDEAVKIQ
jgi:uncharacterized protein YbaR (Trm112 family)